MSQREYRAGLTIYHMNSLASHSICHAPVHSTAAMKAKVKAPRLQGKSVGLFATRTPHRPCNIGLSVAVIDKVL